MKPKWIGNLVHLGASASFEHFLIVQSIDVVAATVSSTLGIVRMVFDGKDPSFQCNTQVPGNTGKVSNQLNGIANEHTEQGPTRMDHGHGVEVRVESEQKGSDQAWIVQFHFRVGTVRYLRK